MPQVKLGLIFSIKEFVNELSYELLKDLKMKKLLNMKKISKSVESVVTSLSSRDKALAIAAKN